MNCRLLTIACLCFLMLSGCNKGKKKQTYVSPHEVQQVMLEYNKRLNQKIKLEMQNFVAASPDSFVLNDNGLFFHELQQGMGKSAEQDHQVEMEISIFAINNTELLPIYKQQIERFAMGKHQMNGINKLLLNKKEGYEVEALMPPLMAFGIGGDGNKIPPARPIFVRLKILKVN